MWVILFSDHVIEYSMIHKTKSKTKNRLFQNLQHKKKHMVLKRQPKYQPIEVKRN